jgi:hypothetical protein
MGMPWRLARYAVHPLTGLLCAQQDGPLPSVPDIEGEHTLDGSVVHTVAGPAIAAITAARGDQTLAVTFDPPVPDLAVLARGSSAGRFHLHASHRRQLGGAWTSASDGGSVRLTLQVDQLWDPGPQPAAARAVFTALAVFRTWPTSYRWEATVARDADPPWMTSRWTRV